MRLLEGGRRKLKTAINVMSSGELDNKCSEIARRIIAVTKLTAAMISSSTAFKPSEPFRDIVPEARRRS